MVWSTRSSTWETLLCVASPTFLGTECQEIDGRLSGRARGRAADGDANARAKTSIATRSLTFDHRAVVTVLSQFHGSDGTQAGGELGYF